MGILLRIYSLTVASFLSPAVCVVLADEYPGPTWTSVLPAKLGLDESKLQEARDYALTGGGAGCIVRNGRLAMTWGDFKQRFDLKSTTKSFGSAVLGLAVGDGLVNLDDPASKHHPEFGRLPVENTRTGWLADITLRHLASQTAGFEKKGGYVPLMFEAGTQWKYSDCGPNWLAECLTLAYGRDLDQVMFERLFTPIGIGRNDLVWRKNQYRPDKIDGITRREFGSGISANVDAMARFGLLWLRDGRWSGQQMLPREYVDLARKTQPGLPEIPVRDSDGYEDASNHYGLLWWNNADESIEGVPLDTYWSWGLGDSLIVVMPTLDIVVARAGNRWSRSQVSEAYAPLKPFIQPIAKAVVNIASARREPSLAESGSYPPSPIIAAIDWAPIESIVRRANGSDNWPTTWADDDSIYTAFGDGWGFDVNRDKSNKLSLGLSKIIGPPSDWRGFNIAQSTANAAGDGRRGRKASGILCIQGTLYLLVRNVDNSQLGWSNDHGATWAWADWKFDESFGCPTFLNFGKDYSGARDEWVYIFSHDSDSAYQRADSFVLARVGKERLREQQFYEYFVQLDADGRSQWTSDISKRGKVFENPGACYRSSVSYNAGLQRYLWCQIGSGDDTRYRGGFSIYDAPEPWGPWTTAFHTTAWDVGPGESSSLPTKWMSNDGRSIHLVFSGDDHFSVRRGLVQLTSPAASSGH